jgi:hypothetical protein
MSPVKKSFGEAGTIASSRMLAALLIPSCMSCRPQLLVSCRSGLGTKRDDVSLGWPR